MIRLALVLLMVAAPALAQLVTEATDEARIRALAATLRCPVCQSESLLESQAATAREMMVIMREQVAAGRTDGEITDFFRTRYGDFVMLAPPPSLMGRAIWALPVILLMLGALVWLRAVRGWRHASRPHGEVPLDAARLERMEP